MQKLITTCQFIVKLLPLLSKLQNNKFLLLASRFSDRLFYIWWFLISLVFWKEQHLIYVRASFLLEFNYVLIDFSNVFCFCTGGRSSCSIPKRRKNWTVRWCWCREDSSYHGTDQQCCKSTWLVIDS